MIKGNIKTAYFEEYGLNIYLNIDDMKFSKKDMKILVLEKSNGESINIEGKNVNWFSKDISNYSGGQFIVSAEIVKKFVGNEKCRIYCRVNEKRETVKLDLRERTNGKNYGIDFEVININNQVIIEPI